MCQVAMDIDEINLALFNNIIFFSYPGEEGHWTVLMMYPDQHRLVFFDPYGLRLSTKWLVVRC
jgi:hypothetical protein